MNKDIVFKIEVVIVSSIVHVSVNTWIISHELIIMCMY